MARNVYLLATTLALGACKASESTTATESAALTPDVAEAVMEDAAAEPPAPASDAGVSPLGDTSWWPATLCTPNEMVCEGPTRVRTCNATGTGYCVEQCPEPQTCQFGLCCVPSCAGKQCGSNGCGGACGTCAQAEVCTAAGMCKTTLCEAASADTFQKTLEGTPLPGVALASGDFLALGNPAGYAWDPSLRITRLGPDGAVSVDKTLVLPGDGGWAVRGMLVSKDGSVVAAADFFPAGDKVGQPAFVRVTTDGALVSAVQQDDLAWSSAWAVGEGGDGDLVFVGTSTVVKDGMQIDSVGFAMRTDASGKRLWFRSLGSPSAQEGLSDVTVLADGSAVAAGTIVNGDVEVAGGLPKSIWLVKLDATGEMTWERTLGESDNVSGGRVVAVEGGFLVDGSASIPGSGGESKPWLAKTDSEGNVTWQKTREKGATLANVAALADGGFVVGGSVGAWDVRDPWLARFGSDGALTWEHTYGGAGREETRFMAPVAGGYVLAGTVDPGPKGAPAGFLIRTGADGAAPACP